MTWEVGVGTACGFVVEVAGLVGLFAAAAVVVLADDDGRGVAAAAVDVVGEGVRGALEMAESVALDFHGLPYSLPWRRSPSPLDIYHVDRGVSCHVRIRYPY